MATLLVATSTDFSGTWLSDIDEVRFTNVGGSVTATFSPLQFDGHQILNSITFTGSAGINGIEIVGTSSPMDLEAFWTFANWGANDKIHIIGTSYDDFVDGSSQNDIIDAGAGNDHLDGGDGNDILRGGKGDDDLYGRAGDDTLRGGGGDDLLVGVFGYDRLKGGAGNDRLEGAGILNGGTGTDSVTLERCSSSVGLTIDISAGGGGADIGNGTRLKNIECLDFAGGSGNDTVTGGALDDDIDGSDGNDRLTGGAGADHISGGNGSDRFDFDDIADSDISDTDRDEISDFTVDLAPGTAFIDRLDFATIDAKSSIAGNQAFTFVGDAAFTAEGQIRAVQSECDTLIEVNTSGTDSAEMTVPLRNVMADYLSAADFIL